VDGEGNVYVAGFSPGAGTGDDITTVKYNKSGEQQWFVTYNGEINESDKADQIVLDDHGEIYVTGTANNGNQLVVVKYDQEGIRLWDETYQKGDYPYHNAELIVDKTGHILLGGSGESSAEGQWNIVKYKQEDYIPTGSSRKMITTADQIQLEFFPNPFRSIATLSYSIPVSGLLTISVYNSLGSQVKTIVNEFRSPGTYRTDFTAGDIPAGLYLIRLQLADDKMGTKKILLIR
jgi:hypothetical protein